MTKYIFMMFTNSNKVKKVKNWALNFAVPTSGADLLSYPFSQEVNGELRASYAVLSHVPADYLPQISPSTYLKIG